MGCNWKCYSCFHCRPSWALQTWKKRGSVPGWRGIRTERWRDVVLEGGWGQRETDPSIKGYNEREQLPAAGSDSTQMWGSLRARQSQGETLESQCHDLILRVRAPTNTSNTFSDAKPATDWRWRLSIPSTHLDVLCAGHSGEFWAVLFMCCLTKLWLNWRGTACQRLISSPPLPNTSRRIKYSHGWLNFFLASIVLNEV